MLVGRSLLIAVILVSLVYGEDLIPVGQPDSDIFYDLNRELYLRGVNKSQSAIFSPLYFDDIVTDDSRPELERIIRPLRHQAKRYMIAPQTMDIDLLVMPHGYFDDDRGDLYLALAPRISYGISKRFSLAVSYLVDGALVDDSLYAGKKWENFAGYVDNAILGYRTQRLSVAVGRRRSRWGIAANGESLILSSGAMPMDGLFLDYDFNRWLSFHSIAACLSPLEYGFSSPADDSTENRYLSAHALKISPFSWWDISLGESVIYGGVGRRLEPSYIFPLLWYHAEQLNSGADDNTFFMMGNVFRWHRRYAAYCELLIDDYQIESETASDNEPNEIGIIAGLDIFDWPLEISAWEIEYTRVNNYTYNQMNPRNVYVNQNFPIGHSLGPDHESLNLSCIYHPTYTLTARIEAYITNRGQGRLGEEWTAPWLDNPDYSEKFPSGVVEKTVGGRLSLYYIKNESLKGKMSIDIADIENDGNISGRDNTRWSVHIQFMVNMPKLSWRDSDE